MPKAPKYVKNPPKKAAKKVAPKKAAAKTKTTLINFVLDKSGSMSICVTDTIGGFNTYVQKLKEDKKNEYLFSLTLFDTRFENRYVAVPLADVPELTTETYVPGGNTALHDAIGTTVAAVEAKGTEYNKVLTVILTDGHENASREYTLGAIKALIARKEVEGNWTFVFLGAGLDAFATGDRMGIRTANTVAYDPQNSRAMYSTMAGATMSYAGATGQSTDNILRGVPQVERRASRMSNRETPKDKLRKPFVGQAVPKS
jgi:uncharacterized protein YegL